MRHRFGGSWTDKKLEVMQRYFSAYAQALKNQPFEKWYIDAFAGTGERIENKRDIATGAPLLSDNAIEVGDVKNGSVRVALAINPPFDRYVFIDLDKDHVAALQELRAEFPERRIDVLSGDANQVLTSLCKNTNWARTRAAVFIDPYGMQVAWSTLQVLGETRSVDIALLYPTGALNRMLTGDGNIPPEWAKRIDHHLGECDWRTASYEEFVDADLFTQSRSTKKKVISTNGLRRFILERLREIFPFVCENQLELRNSKGAVLYHLFIICANPSPAARSLATRLAPSAVSPRKSKR